jgi:hypothetical protein
LVTSGEQQWEGYLDQGERGQKVGNAPHRARHYLPSTVQLTRLLAFPVSAQSRLLDRTERNSDDRTGKQTD